MFCKNCGAQLKDSAPFCPHCGADQIPAEPGMPFADKVRATAKKTGSSSAFLIATLCFSLALILNVLSRESLLGVFTAYSALGELGIALPDLRGALLIFTGICMLPGVFTAIGLLSTYSSSFSRKPKAKTGGLTMIFVVNLVQLVFTCLAVLASLFPLLIFVRGDELRQAIVLAVGLALLAVFAFTLIYYIKLCTTVTNVRSTLKTGRPNKRVSRFIGIMCFISGSIMLLDGISTLLNAGVAALEGFYDETLSYTLPSTYFLSGISALLSATAQIIFGVLIFSYRSKMAALENEERMNNFRTLTHAEPYTAPVYIPPQPAAEPESTA